MKLLSSILIVFLISLPAPLITKVFLLKDTDYKKYSLSDSITFFVKEGVFINPPLIVIDGIPFKYRKNLDTIVLPIKSQDINNVVYLNKNSSHVIYGSKENNGAVIINTKKR